MNTLIVEIIEGHNHPFTVGQGEKMRWKQKAYAHTGGAFPVEFSIALENQQQGLMAGKYIVKPTAYRVGKFGGLELNEWQLRDNLVPATPQQLKEAS